VHPKVIAKIPALKGAVGRVVGKTDDDKIRLEVDGKVYKLKPQWLENASQEAPTQDESNSDASGGTEEDISTTFKGKIAEVKPKANVYMSLLCAADCVFFLLAVVCRNTGPIGMVLGKPSILAGEIISKGMRMHAPPFCFICTIHH
jgi:hypothetical protein